MRHIRRWDRRHPALGYPEEAADSIECVLRGVDELAVPEHVHLFSGEVGEEVLELFAVSAEALVLPKWGPTIGGSPLLGVAGAEEIRLRLEAVTPEVGPVGIGAVDWVTDDGDELGVRCGGGYATVSIEAPQVEGAALTLERPSWGRGEQPLIVIAAPHPFTGTMSITGAALASRPAFAKKELRLLDGAHVQLRVTGQGHVQRGRASLRRADDKKFRQGHPPILVFTIVKVKKETRAMNLSATGCYFGEEQPEPAADAQSGDVGALPFGQNLMQPIGFIVYSPRMGVNSAGHNVGRSPPVAPTATVDGLRR
jgi:hypothetical protein